jgi:PhoPQ-activated pathogenicity-related protein
VGDERTGQSAKYHEALDELHVKEFDITGKSMRGWIMVAPEGRRATRL